MKRFLRLVLEADGLCTLDWTNASFDVPRSVTAVVADLDGLGWSSNTVDAHLVALGLDDRLPRLFICVLPPETQPKAAAYLQPPFSPAEFLGRMHDVLGL